MQLRFELKADQGLNFGGWTIDDVCVVAIGEKVVSPVCGNGTLEDGESCDDGNTVDGDGCSSTCETEGAAAKTDGGCCSTGGNPAGAGALGALVLGAVLRRRRKR
jgi:MYXO-CTERM domain-containing protein